MQCRTALFQGRGKGGKEPSKRALAAAAKAAKGRPLVGGELAGIAVATRDQGLQLFHALGKILYNKRDSPGDAAAAAAAGGGGGGGGGGSGGGGDDDEDEWEPGSEAGTSATQSARYGSSRSSRGPSAAKQMQAAAAAAVAGTAAAQAAPPAWTAVLHDAAAGAARVLPLHTQRPPMRYDPEALLAKAALEPLGAAAFLHENYLDFIDHGAMDDVCGVAGYLSDAALMAAGGVGAGNDRLGFSGLDDTPADGVSSAAASSVAARGLMYSAMHPGPRAFRAMRAPAVFLAQRAAAANAEVMGGTVCALCCAAGSMPAGGSVRALASETLPRLRALSDAPSHAWLSRTMPVQWSYLWNGQVSVVKQLGARAGGAGGLGGGGAAGGDVDVVVDAAAEAEGGGDGGGAEDDPIEDDA
ncbi:hypothetical protein FOA52_006740 [Chlamydomonas sp. UWO 241]|nr:hypothetical protein FOA52_006740 [Chlamydomonas sp. UWO 241]